MKIAYTKISSTEISAEVIVEKSEFEGAKKAVAEKINKKAKIKGYRPGKIPLSVIWGVYKRDIESEASMEIVNDAYREALRSEEMSAALSPTVRPEDAPTKTKFYVGSVGADGSLTFTFSSEVVPKIEIPDLSTLTVRTGAISRGTWVDARIAEQSSMYGSRVQTSNRIEDGDEVVIDYTAHELTTDRPVGNDSYCRFVVGSDGMPLAASAAVRGKVVDDQFECFVEFPDSHYKVEFAGGKFTLRGLILDSNVIEVHPLDDALGALCGFEDFAKLKASYEDMWDQQNLPHLKTRKMALIVDTLLEEHDFDVPSVLVNQEVVRLKGRGQTEYLDGALREQATKNVKGSIIMNHIYSSTPSLQVTVEEVTEKANADAVKFSIPSGEHLIQILKQSNQYEQYMQGLESGKTMEYMLSTPTFVE